LIQGVASRIAFEATDERGNPINISGVLVDDTKQELCKFATLHEGRGVFSYTPGFGMHTATAEVEYLGKKYRFDLPYGFPQGMVMEVDNLTCPDSIIIVFRRNIKTPPKMLGTAVLTGGVLQSAYYTFTKDEETSFKIDKKGLPAGVSQIAVFNSEGNILCDRLVFISKNDCLDVKVKTNKKVYAPHELVEMELSAADKKVNPVKTTFSVSVRDAANAVEYKHNILTDLLLMSEIKGYVHNPSYYFEANDSAHFKALDMLLMVQGWRRYSWKQMINDVKTFEPKFFPEQGIETRGTVVSYFRQIPKPNVDVSLFLSKIGEENEKDSIFIETFITDSLGHFYFVLDVEGKWNMIVSAMEKGKKKDYRILLDKLFSPKPERYRYSDMQISIAEENKEYINDDKPDIEEDSCQFSDTYTDSLVNAGINKKVHNLPTVKITAKKRSNEQNIYRNRSTSIAYYDVPSEVDEVYDKGKLVVDINYLIKSLNSDFIVRQNIETLYYRGKKVAFVINYEQTDVSDDYYFYYQTIRLNAIKSIYINENKSIMAQYLYDSSDHKISPFELADKFGCVIFIETYPQGKIPVDADKGVRKTWLEGYSAVKDFYNPDYSTLPDAPDDYRRILYWNPAVTTDETGIAKIKFYNNSSCKNFIISAETVTPEGMIGVNIP